MICLINIQDIIFLVIVVIISIIYSIILTFKKFKGNKIKKERELAIQVISEFENLLDEYGMKFPCDETENEDRACIYGDIYYGLEDKIVSIIKSK